MALIRRLLSSQTRALWALCLHFVTTTVFVLLSSVKRPGLGSVRWTATAQRDPMVTCSLCAEDRKRKGKCEWWTANEQIWWQTKLLHIETRQTGVCSRARCCSIAHWLGLTLVRIIKDPTKSHAGEEKLALQVSGRATEAWKWKHGAQTRFTHEGGGFN